MEKLPKQIDNYIKESIDRSLNLPVSDKTLQLKLRSLEHAELTLRDRCHALHSAIEEKNQLIDRIRAEAGMNGRAVKKFVEENERLAEECRKLVGKCEKFEKECSLYERDREVLMDFGNEADERAKEAVARVSVLEEEVGRLTDELQDYKDDADRRKNQEDSSPEDSKASEENFLESVLDSLIMKDAGISGQAFLEANSGHESYQKLLKMWNCLRPSSQKVLSLAALVKTLEKDKEHIRINLHKAEEEVNVLYQENKILNVENKLLRKIQKDKSNSASAGKLISSSSVKSNKRKSSAMEMNQLLGEDNYQLL